MRQTRFITAVLVTLAAFAARADTVEVTSTTMVTAGQQTRGGQAGQKPDLATVVPAFEILSLSARNVTNPFADDLQIVVSTWGALDLKDRRWDAGVNQDYSGDVVAGYVQGKFWKRHVIVRVGRAQVNVGASRNIQLDGGQVSLYGPVGLSLVGYAGSPVAQRFSSREGLKSWNPVGGDLAYGGRLGWALALPGAPGRGLEIGASANVVEDAGNPVRKEAAVDLRFQPIGPLTISGFGAYALTDEALSEANVAATYLVNEKLFVTADWKLVRPDLLLSRGSIFSVFSDAQRNEVGGGVTYELMHGLRAGVDYHFQLEPQYVFAVPPAQRSAARADTKLDKNYFGQDVAGRLDWRKGTVSAGAEVSYLDATENGWTGARVYGKKTYGKLFAVADVQGHFFREKVNGQSNAVNGTLTAGYTLPNGFQAVLSGRAGVNPFLEQTFDVLAKLVYNQTYRLKEER